VKTFVSGLDPQAVHAETLARPGLRDLRRVMRYPVDRATNTVDVSVLGLMASHTVFRDGVGCVLRHGSPAPYQLRSDIDAPKEPKTPPLLPEIAGPDLVEPADPALKAAAVSCLRGTDAPPYRRTEAVVIVHDGQVIAERCADGVGINTPLPGFSMTKSMVNALLGLLTRQGVLTPSFPAPVPEWHAAFDPRHEIEIELMMRMTTGLELDEADSGFDPSS
jgi:hypothetical protein